MKCRLLFMGMLVTLSFSPTLAQNPESFFPHNVGDRWEYADLTSGGISVMEISKDSIGMDGTHNLYYNNFFEYPQYSIDSTLNVYFFPQDTSINFLYYKLPADTGEVWENPNSILFRWAWVARVESAYVFSTPTIIKEIRYGPGYPESANSPGLLEHWLASGFGLIYSWQEPNDISSLLGCVIDADTFGVVTSVKQLEPENPKEYFLKQNYPNPFNPGTTIEFQLPKEAKISLTVYDILGRQAAILHKGSMMAGNYKVQWNAEEFSSGLYICRLQTGRSIRAIKMLLTK